MNHYILTASHVRYVAVDMLWTFLWNYVYMSVFHLWECWFFNHDDVIKWKHFPRYWPFVRGIHRSTVNSPHKGQWRGSLMFSLICGRINGWVNTHEAGDLRRHRVIVMCRPHAGVVTNSHFMLGHNLNESLLFDDLTLAWNSNGY